MFYKAMSSFSGEHEILLNTGCFSRGKKKVYKTRNFRSSFGVKKSGHLPGNSTSRKNRDFQRSSANFSGRSFRRSKGEQIDVTKFIRRTPSAGKNDGYSARHSFKDFGFCPELQANLDKKQFSAPTAIQDQGIKPVLEGRDLIGLANTGTGKTAVFLLPLIEKINKRRYEKVLIIAPTRELAIQIDNELKAFVAGMRIFSTICVGGTNIGRQISGLKQNPNFIIGTPGRLKDLSERGLIRFDAFQSVVLDEVDRMLDMGFVNEITRIMNALPVKRQTLFFSATMPLKIKTLAKQFLTDPVTVEVKTGDTAANVLQDIVQVNDKSEKLNKLKDLLNLPEMTKVLIFTETKWEVEKLAVNLSKDGYLAESIHGNKRQSQRERSLASFRNDRCRILVATDVAARGLDIGDISHVINYTVPQTYDDYIHRIGRTGRGGKTGQALTFVE